MAAAAAKASRLKPLEPIRVEAWQHATVVGGGVAGMRAALSLAERGMEVALVEKSSGFLGGQLAKLDRIAPTSEKAADIIAELAGQVLADHPSRHPAHEIGRVSRATSPATSATWRAAQAPPWRVPLNSGAGVYAGNLPSKPGVALAIGGW